MEPNRFDDVEIRVVDEASEPRKTRRLGHGALALTAAVALMGSLAAGASALTSTAQAPTVEKGYHHGLCDKAASPAVKY
jgi:hypothetical protein